MMDSYENISKDKDHKLLQDAPLQQKPEIRYRFPHRTDLHSSMVDKDIRLINEVKVFPLLQEEEPVFCARKLINANEKDLYASKLLADKSSLYTEEERRDFLKQTAGKREELWEKAYTLKEKIHTAKTVQDKLEVMETRLALLKLDCQSQQFFCMATAEDREKEKFFISAASIRELRSGLAILTDAKAEGLDVDDRIQSVSKRLLFEEELLRKSTAFSNYKKEYLEKYRETGLDQKTLNETDQEGVLRLVDFDPKEIGIRKRDYALSELKEREKKLLSSRFKEEKDSAEMKAVKDGFSRLVNTLTNPGGDYTAQKEAIFSCYADLKNACQIYIKDHTDKWFSFMRSEEGKKRRRMVQELLDRITFEQNALFKNMAFLKKKDPDATWGHALELTRQTAELHMLYLGQQQKITKGKAEGIRWDSIAQPKEEPVDSAAKAYELIQNSFSLPISEDMLNSSFSTQTAPALPVILTYAKKLKQFADPGNEEFQKLPDILKQELLIKTDQLSILAEGMQLILDAQGAGADLKDLPERLKKSIEKRREMLHSAIKGGNTKFDAVGGISIKNKGTKELIRLRAKSYHLEKSEQEKNRIRTKESYVLPFQAFPQKVELDKHQKKNKLNSTRSVIEKVIGRKVYAKYDEMVQKIDEKDRTIHLHHAFGTRLKEKNRVINLDMAGSGFKEFRREASGSHGKTSVDKFATEEDKNLFLSTYGTHYRMDGKEDKKYLFTKGDLTHDQKVHFSIGGVQSPKGLINYGDYSIDNQVEYAYTMLITQLSPIAAEWKNGSGKDRPVIINLQSHSRGAVAAGKAVLMVHEWLKKGLGTQYEDCKNLLKINMIQLDPVAGFGSDSGLNHAIDLKNEYSVTEDGRTYTGFPDEGMINATTVYSMFCDYSSSTFPPQQVRGQERIILKAVRHNMALDRVDASQLTAAGDGKVHRRMVVDSETLEGYRGSGYHELPPGVYVEDENGVLVRMRNLDEATRVMEGLKKDLGDQAGRQEALRTVIRNWFVDHASVDVSVKEKEKGKKPSNVNVFHKLQKRMDAVKDDTRTLFEDSFRMKLIKQSIERLDGMLQFTVTKNTNLRALKAKTAEYYFELIRVCEEYQAARGKEEKDPLSRHGKVTALIPYAKAALAQMQSISDLRFQGLFSEGQEKMSLRDLLLTDGSKRVLDDAFQKMVLRDAAEIHHRRAHLTLLQHESEQPEDHQLRSVLNDYIAKQGAPLPLRREEFDRQKRKLLISSNSAITKLKSITEEAAFLESSKIRREKACRLLKQLQWEQEKLAAADFDRLMAMHMQNWENVWTGDGLIINTTEASDSLMGVFHEEEETVDMTRPAFVTKQAEDGRMITGKQYVHGDELHLPAEYDGIIGKSAKENAKATAQMAALLGVGDLFSRVLDVKLVSDNVHLSGSGEKQFHGQEIRGYADLAEGMTLPEALEVAEKEKMNLIYSGEALKQLTSIRLMDVICGQVNRSDRSLHVTLGKESREGENYLVIKRVMASNNEFSFGTASFSMINQTLETSTLKKIDTEIDGKSVLAFSAFDFELAERILYFDIDALYPYFSALGEDRLNALKDRFLHVQELIRGQKKDAYSTWSRYKWLKANRDADGMKKLNEALMGEFERQAKERGGDVTYVHKALLQDNGITEELTKKTDENGHNINAFDDGLWDLSSANEYIDDRLHSVRLRKQKANEVKNLVVRDRRNAALSTQRDFAAILELMEGYADLEGTTEKGIEAEAKKERTSSFMRRFAPWLGEQVSEKLKSRGVKDGLALLEGEVAVIARTMIKERIETLNGLKIRTEQQETELERLMEYFLVFSDMDGLMHIPPQVHESEDSYRLYFKEGGEKEGEEEMNWPEEQRNEENAPLFPHEPCIQDVGQGTVGDCYFLAALAAVVEADPSLIKKMMRDDGNGHVYVRFYDEDKKPFYVKVKKSVPENAVADSKYAHGAFWVQMLEKAFVVSGLHGKGLLYFDRRKDKIRFEKNTEEGKRSYDDISGGNADEAFRLLLGSHADFFSLDSSNQDQRILNKDKTILNKERPSAVKKMTDRLRDVQNRGQIAVISSRKNFIGAVSQHPGGKEYMERGFASQHAYTFLGLEEKDGIVCARLRNPWGRGAVESIRNELTGFRSYQAAKRDRTGSFLVDMKTLVTYMNYVCVTNRPQN